MQQTGGSGKHMPVRQKISALMNTLEYSSLNFRKYSKDVYFLYFWHDFICFTPFPVKVASLTPPVFRCASTQQNKFGLIVASVPARSTPAQ